MAFQYNQLIAKILSKCCSKDSQKQKELKIVIVNIVITLLYLFISALVSLSNDDYNYIQALYVWFVTMTTIGLGDYVPKETTNPYTLLFGLCFMSGTIDAIVTYYESNHQSSVGKTLKRCMCCCNSTTHSVEGDMAHVEDDGSKEVGTQTDGMMNYGISDNAFTVS